MKTKDPIVDAFRPVIHKEDGRYWAEIPAMPGCLTEGDTPEEVRANIVEAAKGWLEAKLDWLMGRLPAPSVRRRATRRKVAALA